MARTVADLTAAELAFLAERHLATLSTNGPSGTLHVVAIAFTFDPAVSLARIITTDESQKVRNVERTGRAAVCQVDGRHWLSLEGRAVVRRDAHSVSEAEHRYAARYRVPRPNPRRVVIELAVEAILGSA